MAAEAATDRQWLAEPERQMRGIALTGALVAACALLVGLALDDRPATGLVDSLAFVIPVAALVAVGTLIVVRRGRNLVGWLCWLAGVLAALAIASGTYTAHALSLRAPLPGAMATGWFALWLGETWVSILLAIPLVFPDGRLPSRRWRPVAWLVVAGIVSLIAVSAFDPTAHEGTPLSHNPLGVDAAEPLFTVLDRATFASVPVMLAAGVASLLVRVRRSRGIEQLQVKWLLYAVALVALLFVLEALAPAALSLRMSDVVFGLGYGTVPIAIGVAVLRYRLYDIDHIIRRTIVYASLTAMLGLVYAGGVLIVGSLVGNGRRSDLAVAASTLVAAALFRPLRARTQNMVDRRFNRQQFDAARTVAAFSEAVREELDADALIREVLTVTGRVFEPTHLSFWRPTCRSQGAGRTD